MLNKLVYKVNRYAKTESFLGNKPKVSQAKEM
jgi:hypothetical protein